MTDTHRRFSELPGNHIIARLSHDATLRSLDAHSDAVGPGARQRAESVAHEFPDGLWSSMPPQDCCDEASMESFPASDPPAFSACHA